MRNMVQYMQLIGSFVGLLLVNHISEAWGRKSAIVLALSFGVIGNACIFVLLFSYSYW